MDNAEHAPFRLDGRVALVTGAASGIGAATARALARNGADLALGWYAQDPHEIDGVVADVEALGRRALAIEGDVADTAAVEATVSRAADELGRLDIVVANAAIARATDSAELSDDEWSRVLDVDLAGVFRCFRAAIPHMRRAGWGRLLATSSVSGTSVGWSRHAHYSAAKAGIAGMVKALAVELAPTGITVNALAPGIIVTAQSLDPVSSLGPDGLAEIVNRIPARRNGEPEDIANVFAFLASEESAYLTGQTIVVDGGFTITLD
ncbi:3-oxoacyl-[acyl-carrier-protein] reductase FabG [Capillimicrobium parvum]|uniref:3-oxoacyl-[acyl-carrier-protein] reductase FabG n=2 Tax=Capillimicrobium parvum TaxID=2884022 RepID=A0A9E6XZW2_9ACTN|nr:3-oxoacyl-[acyl-carrier-protein] reductase FabG [Capillimicrobium parvum]